MSEYKSVREMVKKSPLTTMAALAPLGDIASGVVSRERRLAHQLLFDWYIFLSAFTLLIRAQGRFESWIHEVHEVQVTWFKLEKRVLQELDNITIEMHS